MTLPQSNPGTSPAPRSSSLSSQSFAPPTITQADAKPLHRPTPTPTEREAIAQEILGTPDKPSDPAPSSLLTSQSLFAAVAIAAGAALLVWAAWQGTRRARRGAIRAHTPAAAPVTVVKPDPRATELLAAAQNIAEQLDARAAQLERTLQAANARIAQLEQVGAAAVSGARASAPTQAPATPQRARSNAPTVAPSELRESKPRDPSRDPMVATPAAFTTSHRDIYDLADQGMTPVQIAQKLSKPTGQIELILNLRKAAHASAS